MDLKAVMLAEQFRDLQLKQKEKFKERVTKLHSKPSGRPTIDRATDCVDTASMPSDDLGLITATQERMTALPEITVKVGRVEDNSSKDGSLRTKVEQLKSEKTGLSSRLRSTEKQLEALRKTLQEEREVLGNGGVGGAATTQKVVELSKKNRLLHAELASERNRCRKMEKEMDTVKAAQHVSKQETRDQGGVVEDDEKRFKLQLNELQEQLTQCRNKMADYRSQCQLLKQELRLAHRAIAKEVGGGVTVSQLLNSPSGWRGRSQQIITLQNKLLEMKSLLKTTPETVTESANVRLATSSEGGQRVEARQKAALEKMGRERRQNLESVRRELEAAQTESARLHKECTALRARNKILTEDVKLLKSGSVTVRRNRATSSGGREMNRTANLLALESKLSELEQDNRLLRHQLQECEKVLLKHRQKNSRPAMRAEVLSLPALHRPPSHQTQPIPPSHQTEPIRDSLSATVKHETYSLREAQVLTHVAEADRDKLLDLTMTLQQRLDSMTEQLIQLKLENSAGRVHKLPCLGRSSYNGVVTKQKLRSDTDCEKVEALEVEMEILRDENAVLKETLTQLRRDKLEDTRMFHTSMQNTQRMYVELMRGQVQTDTQL